MVMRTDTRVRTDFRSLPNCELNPFKIRFTAVIWEKKSILKFPNSLLNGQQVLNMILETDLDYHSR